MVPYIHLLQISPSYTLHHGLQHLNAIHLMTVTCVNSTATMCLLAAVSTGHLQGSGTICEGNKGGWTRQQRCL